MERWNSAEISRNRGTWRWNRLALRNSPASGSGYRQRDYTLLGWPVMLICLGTAISSTMLLFQNRPLFTISQEGLFLRSHYPLIKPKFFTWKDVDRISTLTINSGRYIAIDSKASKRMLLRPYALKGAKFDHMFDQLKALQLKYGN